MDFYNGYTSRERDKKYQEYKRRRLLGLTPPELGPCQLCLDPSAPVEAHSEDYSLPYLWTPPAEYMICRSCHSWLHKRFKQPAVWALFKDHLRRGGYAREFASPAVRVERAAATSARDKGLVYVWTVWEGRAPRAGLDWWEHLTVAPDSLTSATARARP